MVPNEVFLDEELRATDIAVYASIKSFLYSNRPWAPSYVQIARRAGCSTKTARMSARRLEDWGYFMISRPKVPEGQSKPGRPAHIFTLVENRHGFLEDRARRDKEHADRVQQEGHEETIQIQVEATKDEISKEEANARLRKIREKMNRRSPRVPIDPPSEFR